MEAASTKNNTIERIKFCILIFCSSLGVMRKKERSLLIKMKRKNKNAVNPTNKEYNEGL